MVRKFCEKLFPLEIWGDGEDSRDLIYVDDVVEYVVRSFECTGFNAYNVGVGENYTVNEIVNMLGEICNTHPEITYLTDKPKMIKKRLVSVERIASELNFKPTISLSDGLQKTVAWFNENVDKIYR